MCGIIAVTGRPDAARVLIQGLERLEYRGYDSAGLSVTDGEGGIVRVRVAGKVNELKAAWNSREAGSCGIAHTRWATHGPATEANAHPHTAGRVHVVHNGIIENYRSLREAATKAGATFHSQTDTEVIAWLYAAALEESNDAVDAFQRTVRKLEGAYSLAVMVDGEDDLLLGARRGAPLLAGFDDTAGYLASDPLALAGEAQSLIFLEDGEIAAVRPGRVDITDLTGRAVTRPVQPAQLSPVLAEKGSYRHFMEKEIHEQPEVVARTLGAYVDQVENTIRARDGLDFSKASRLLVVGCGTAAYAGEVAEYWFERIARLPTEVDIASEFRYRDPAFLEGDVALFISQSGETADTLEAMRLCKAAGLITVALVNTAHSTMAREADIVAPTLAGPEIGVASTKAFSCQLAALACLAVRAGIERGHLDTASVTDHVAQLMAIPGTMSEALRADAQIDQLARDLSRSEIVLYLGRDQYFPMALEGALKLKEISYIHAEGYAAGELKHGPIALVEEGVSVIVLAPSDALFAKTRSSIEQVRARGAHVLALTDEAGAEALEGLVQASILLPAARGAANLMSAAVAVQLIAYHVAVHKGTDVDQPRNLAKSVTVE
jgi:glutamine---fructose-6-phosphate transaminase (isomerizing)